MPEAMTGESRRDGLVHGLVKALITVACMQTPADRQLFVRFLADEIGDGFVVPEQGSARSQAIAIVRECLRHDGGEHAFIDALQLFAPDERGTLEAANLIRSHVVLDVLPSAARHAIHVLLGLAEGLDIIHVDALWYLAADELAPLPAGDAITLTAAFDHLSRLNARSDRLPPSLAFIEHVAALLSSDVPTRLPIGDLPAQLRRWADEQAARMGLTAELAALRRIVGSAGPPSTAQPSLVIQLIEHGLGDGRYIVSYWTQHRPGPWHPERGESWTVPLAQACEVVDEARRRAEAVWGNRPGKVFLEFILPSSLLNQPVEWWVADPGSRTARPLCVNYPIVVRSLERIRTPWLHRYWRNRWAAMTSATALSAQWAPGEDGARLWNARLNANEGISAVILSGPPQPIPKGDEDYLWMAIAAGVPVVIWDRRENSTQESKNVIKSLVGGLPMSLSERVSALRRAAAVDPSNGHPGQHITVLWDDPTRLVDVSPYPARIQDWPTAGSPR